MEYQQKYMKINDLCTISEHFRDLKKTMKLKDVQNILKRTVEIYLQKDSVENYLNDFFRGEAEKIINKKRHCEGISKEEDANKWPKVYEASFDKYAEKITKLKQQYVKDVQEYSFLLPEQ